MVLMLDEAVNAVSCVGPTSRSKREFRQSASQRFHELRTGGFLGRRSVFRRALRVTGAAKQLAVKGAKPS